MPLHYFYWFLLAALGTLLLYIPGLSGPFLLDDITSVQTAVLRTWTWENFFGKMLDNTSGPLGRPLAVASFLANHYFFGPNPFSYKLTNVLLHLLIGGLIFRLLSQIGQYLQQTAKDALKIATLASILWLIHPLQVSTALYPVQRMAQLSDLFIVLACLGYTTGRLRQIYQQPHSTRVLYASALIFFPLALLSKETGALLALYYACLEGFIFQFSFPTPQTRRTTYGFLGLFCLLPCLLACGYLIYRWDIYLGRYHTQLFGLFDRLRSEPVVLLFYLKELIVPRVSEMSLFLDDFPVYTHWNGIVLGALAFHGVLWGLVWKGWKKYPLICFGIAWFYASHALESTILPLELAFEHRNYLASMGIFIVLADVWFRALNKVDIKPLVKQALLGVWLVLLAHLTYLRVMGWENLGVFLSLAVDEHPKSARAHVFWANYLLEHGLKEQSFQELTLARTLAPRNSGMIIHKLLFYCDMPIPSALIQELEESLKNEVLTAYSLSALDTLITRALKGSCSAVPPALLVHLFQLATQNPNVQYQKNWLSSLYQYRAYAYFLNKEYDNGMTCLDKSFELYPKRITPLLNKAEYQIMNHRLQEAEQTLILIHQKLQKRPYAFSDYIPLIEEKLKKAKKEKNTL